MKLFDFLQCYCMLHNFFLPPLYMPIAAVYQRKKSFCIITGSEMTLATHNNMLHYRTLDIFIEHRKQINIFPSINVAAVWLAKEERRTAYTSKWYRSWTILYAILYLAIIIANMCSNQVISSCKFNSNVHITWSLKSHRIDDKWENFLSDFYRTKGIIIGVSFSWVFHVAFFN